MKLKIISKKTLFYKKYASMKLTTIVLCKKTYIFIIILLMPCAVTHADAVSYKEAFRLLKQSTFGPVALDISSVQTLGVTAWVENQLNMPSAYTSNDDTHLTHLERLIDIATSVEPKANWFKSTDNGKYFNGGGTSRTADYQMSTWFENALNGEDQLRQRVAYALSQIMVVSAHQLPLDRQAESLAHYYDILARNAFGDFRTLLGEVARSPAMGIYLSHQGNAKANPYKNTLPDENFARELLQLFTIGLYELEIDGTVILDKNNEPIPSYSQFDVEELARVMTGWDLRHNSRFGRQDGDYTSLMEFTAGKHDFYGKEILGHKISDNIPSGGDLDLALDIIASHKNVAPFISKRLIQRMITSNPSAAYIKRVARVFNDNGMGQRGDLRSVVRAIILDSEARNVEDNLDYFGKVNEPILAYTAFYRAFNVKPLDGWMIDSEYGRVPTKNTYYFRIHEILGQGPLRAPHVFNFYDNDYVPSDNFYQDSIPKKVLPEMQIRTSRNIALQFEALKIAKHVLEINDISRRYSNISNYVSDRNTIKQSWNWARAIALIDFSPALDSLEMGVDGDADGNFSAIKDDRVDSNGDTPKVRGIRVLLSFLERNLLGDTELLEVDKEKLMEYLSTDDYFKLANNTDEAYRITVSAIQYFLMSSANFTQK